MKILVDMNLSPGWVSFFCRRWFRGGSLVKRCPGSAADSELMQWAAEHDYVVLTADLDFSAILAATQRRKPSVIQLRSDLLTPRAIGAAVVTALHQAHEELVNGAIVSLDSVRARLRILPLND